MNKRLAWGRRHPRPTSDRYRRSKAIVALRLAAGDHEIDDLWHCVDTPSAKLIENVSPVALELVLPKLGPSATLVLLFFEPSGHPRYLSVVERTRRSVQPNTIPSNMLNDQAELPRPWRVDLLGVGLLSAR